MPEVSRTIHNCLTLIFDIYDMILYHDKWYSAYVPHSDIVYSILPSIKTQRVIAQIKVYRESTLR